MADLSSYSEEELLRIAGMAGNGPGPIGGAVPLMPPDQAAQTLDVLGAAPLPTNDLSAMSDEELERLAGSGAATPKMPPVPVFPYNEPGYIYGDVFPYRKNVKTGEKELAYPEFMRSAARGWLDLERMAQERSTEMTPDAVGVSMGVGPGSVVSRMGAKNALMKPPKLKSAGPPPLSDELREAGSVLFRRAQDEGGVIPPDKVNAWLGASGQKIRITDAGKIMFGDSPATQRLEKAESLRNRPMTLEEAQDIDSRLGMEMEKFVDPRSGKLLGEGEELMQIQQALRDIIDEMPDDGFKTLRSAKDLWSAQARARDVERVLTRASRMDVPQTAIKNGFNTLASNPKRMRGRAPEEIEAINRAAETGMLTGALKFTGSRLIGGMAGAAAGSVGGGPAGAIFGTLAGGAAGYPFRKGAEAIQTAKGNKVLSIIKNDPKVQKGLNLARTEPPPPPPPPMKLLPAPKPPQPEYVVDWQGRARPQTPEERNAAMMQRRQNVSVSLSPDVVAAQERNRVNAVWDAVRADEMARIRAQQEMMWNQTRPATIDDMVAKALMQQNDVARVTGESPPNTAMRQAIIDAILLGKKK